VLSIWQATRDVLSTARNEKPQAGYPCPLLLGKGSTFCHACICNDNDHAGDIVRTCRDYVIGCSRNVAAMVIPHQTSRGSASRHLQALSSQFTLFLLPPTLRTWALIGDVYFNCVIHNVAPQAFANNLKGNHYILIVLIYNVTKKAVW